MIEKSLLLKKSFFAISSPDPNVIPITHFGTDILSKTITERWNQANLGYLNLHLNRVHGKGEIVLVGKDVYYRNVVLFI